MPAQFVLPGETCFPTLLLLLGHPPSAMHDHADPQTEFYLSPASQVLHVKQFPQVCFPPRRPPGRRVEIEERNR